MTDKAFWDFVEGLNWGDQDPDDESTYINTKEIKAQILWNHSPFEVQDIRNTFAEKRKDLHAVAWNHIYTMDDPPYISNDGLDDTLCQVVGEGEEAYNIALTHPDLIIERLQEFDYIESFAYAIPVVADYKYISEDQYYPLLYQYQNKIKSVYSGLEDEHQSVARELIKMLPTVPHITSEDKLNELIDISEQLTERSNEYCDVVGHSVQHTIRDYMTYITPFQ